MEVYYEKNKFLFDYISRNFLGKSGNICESIGENGFDFHGYCRSTGCRDRSDNFFGYLIYEEGIAEDKDTGHLDF